MDGPTPMENRPWSRDSDIEGFQVGIFLFFGRYDVRALFFGTGSSMGFSTDFLELFLGWMLVYDLFMYFFWGLVVLLSLDFLVIFCLGLESHQKSLSNHHLGHPFHHHRRVANLSLKFARPQEEADRERVSKKRPRCMGNVCQNYVVVSIFFGMFAPISGEMIQSDEHIFRWVETAN